MVWTTHIAVMRPRRPADFEAMSESMPPHERAKRFMSEKHAPSGPATVGVHAVVAREVRHELVVHAELDAEAEAVGDGMMSALVLEKPRTIRCRRPWTSAWRRRPRAACTSRPAGRGRSR